MRPLGSKIHEDRVEPDVAQPRTAARHLRSATHRDQSPIDLEHRGLAREIDETAGFGASTAREKQQRNKYRASATRSTVDTHTAPDSRAGKSTQRA